MGSYEFNAAAVMLSTWSHLAASDAASVPVAVLRQLAESAALLVDEVFPKQPVRQWVLSFPYPLRLLLASRPAIMGRVLGIVYRCIATHLIKAAPAHPCARGISASLHVKAGFSCTTARTGAVTLIQRFGSALNLNIHLTCRTH
jgi:hypothetical protein